MTYTSEPFYPHRRNKDGSFSSVCLNCLGTVGTSMIETELAEHDKKHVCSDSLAAKRGAGVTEIRTPKVGDRVAIPGHAVIFIVKSVDELTKTVNVDMTTRAERTEDQIPWKILTFIDL
jgi:hypothetical protein